MSGIRKTILSLFLFSPLSVNAGNIANEKCLNGNDDIDVKIVKESEPEPYINAKFRSKELSHGYFELVLVIDDSDIEMEVFKTPFDRNVRKLILNKSDLYHKMYSSSVSNIIDKYIVGDVIEIDPNSKETFYEAYSVGNVRLANCIE